MMKEITNISNNICYKFDTVNFSPIELVRFTSGKYTDLVFIITYMEDENSGGGVFIYYQGAQICEFCVDNECKMADMIQRYLGSSTEEKAS